MTVSLKDFVSQTLRAILDGVMEVQKGQNVGKYISSFGGLDRWNTRQTAVWSARVPLPPRW